MARRIPVIVDSIGDRGCSRQDARRSHFINRYPQCSTIQVSRLNKRRRFHYSIAGFFVKQLKYKLSLSMSTLATDSKDCALLAPRSSREELQQSFNGKTEYDNRTRLTSWPTAPNGTANVKEEVWPLWKEKFWCTLGINPHHETYGTFQSSSKGSCPTSKVRGCIGGPNSKPNSTDAQLDTFHYLYPRGVSGKASSSGDPSGLDLRSNPSLR